MRPCMKSFVCKIYGIPSSLVPLIFTLKLQSVIFFRENLGPQNRKYGPPQHPSHPQICEPEEATQSVMGLAFHNPRFRRTDLGDLHCYVTCICSRGVSYFLLLLPLELSRLSCDPAFLAQLLLVQLGPRASWCPHHFPLPVLPGRSLTNLDLHYPFSFLPLSLLSVQGLCPLFTFLVVTPLG